jgi:hypothetical protein
LLLPSLLLLMGDGGVGGSGKASAGPGSAMGGGMRLRFFTAARDFGTTVPGTETRRNRVEIVGAIVNYRDRISSV